MGFNFVLRIRITHLEDGKYAKSFKLSEFGVDCKDLITMIAKPHALPNFSKKLNTIKTLQRQFRAFMISQV